MCKLYMMVKNMCYNEFEVKQNDQIEKKNRYIFNRMEE